MNVETKIYHCSDPQENPVPFWMKRVKVKPQQTKEPDLVEQFKKCPESFFPSFYGKKP